MKCFYHSDIDGRCAGSVVAQFTGNYNRNDYFEVDYIMKLPLNEVTEGETVYFVDYSFKKDTFIEIVDWLITYRNAKIIWIDHHTSSLRLLEEYIPQSRDIQFLIKDNVSGAALTYMYLYEMEFDKLPHYVQLVSDYDCWIYKYDPDTTFFKLGIESEKYDALDLVWKSLFDESEDTGYYKMIETAKIRIIQTGATIKDYVDKDNEQYRNAWAYETMIDGLKCLVINRKSNSWIFGDKYKEYPIVMVWAFNGTKYSYSIFSSDSNVDCSKIAEKLGGGGHRGAAGFSSDELLFKEVRR